MNERDAVRVSKRMSLVLRHKPESVGLCLDPAGWVPVSELLSALARHGTRLTRSELDDIVAGNNKRRFEIVGERIRARQGHSVAVDLGLPPLDPPEELYHGTAIDRLGSIRERGLLRGDRHHVHLSSDVETARKVGARHGKPVVLTVHSGRLAATGAIFHRTDNGVWLTGHVPPRFLADPSGLLWRSSD